MEMPKKPPTAY